MAEQTGCIYVLLHDSWKTYVGQTVHPDKRVRDHRGLLARGKHANPHLQATFNRDGWGSFCYHVIEKGIPIEELDDREMYWIFYLRTNEPEFGYNMIDQVEGSPMLGRQHRQEAKDAMSVAHKALCVGEEKARLLRVRQLQKFDKELSVHRSLLYRATKPGACRLNAKKFVAISPEGIEYRGDSLLAFCKQRGLVYSAMRSMASGQTQTSRTGWCCRYEDQQ